MFETAVCHTQSVLYPSYVGLSPRTIERNTSGFSSGGASLKHYATSTQSDRNQKLLSVSGEKIFSILYRPSNHRIPLLYSL